MANKEQKLFAEFPPVSTEAWEAAINKDLKGADYEKKLVWRTAEGFNVRPYYRAEDLKGIEYLGSQCGEFPYVRGTKKDNDWKIVQTLEVDSPKAANAQATVLLTKGVESIGFVIKDKAFDKSALDTLLAGISVKNTELVFSGCAVKEVADLFIDKLEREGIDPETVKANFVIDPIIRKMTLKGKALCKEGCKCFENLASLISRGAKYKRLRFVNVSGDAFQNCGSTIVQELAFTLAAGHEYLVRLMDQGLSIDQAASALRFSMSIGSNYFMEIAKLRAARMLWANIVSAYNPSRGCAAKMKVHAVTSQWNMTIFDAHVNLLRSQTEAMSAAIAGVDSITVRPFDEAYETPDDFAERIARNQQLLLKEECHFDKVVDPGAGSYTIEVFTNSIADVAWKLFLETEEKGGFGSLANAGEIQASVNASNEARHKAVATRRESLLGTNQFPNFTEVAGDKVKKEEGACCCKGQHHNHCENEGVTKLNFARGASEFEALRLATEKSEKTPKAFMLTIGNLAMRLARAQFSCNFFACAGYKTIDNLGFDTVEEGVEAAMKAGADIVVLCSSDDEYAEYAPAAFKALNGRAQFVVAGAPACMEDLKAQGIDQFIHVKSNVLETLQGFNAKLGI